MSPDFIWRRMTVWTRVDQKPAEAGVRDSSLTTHLHYTLSSKSALGWHPDWNWAHLKKKQLWWGGSSHFPWLDTLCLPACSRCAHICQRSHWPDVGHLDWRPHCRLALGAWSVCGCRFLSPHPRDGLWSQMMRCGWTTVDMPLKPVECYCAHSVRSSETGPKESCGRVLCFWRTRSDMETQVPFSSPKSQVKDRD